MFEVSYEILEQTKSAFVADILLDAPQRVPGMYCAIRIEHHHPPCRPVNCNIAQFFVVAGKAVHLGVAVADYCGKACGILLCACARQKGRVMAETGPVISVPERLYQKSLEKRLDKSDFSPYFYLE
jgi:hypothetical protein